MNHRYLSRCEREKLPSTIEKSSIYTINPFPFIILRYQGPNYSLQIPVTNAFSNHTYSQSWSKITKIRNGELVWG